MTLKKKNEPAVTAALAATEETQAAITPMSMLDRAIASGASVEVLERLMSLQARWQAAEARRAFSAALAALRHDMPQIVKTQQVDFSTGRGRTEYKYEDLAEIIGAVSEPMAQHGLSFRWRTDSDTPGQVKVTCLLEHADGHSETTALSGPYDDSGNKNAIQAIGSVVTYLQRYTLKAALGIAAARDDDGRHGAPQGSPPPREEPQRPAQARKPAAAPAAPKDYAAIVKKMREGLPPLLTSDQFDAAMDQLDIPKNGVTDILGTDLISYLELTPNATNLSALEIVLTALEDKLAPLDTLDF